MSNCRVGFGYDVHQLVTGRDLIIGGVRIPYHKGALGYSEADVLLHALTDAILGAAGLEDIGTLFPDDAPEFKDADSRWFLTEAFRRVKARGYRILNADATVVLQEPKLSVYIPGMKSIIASDLEIQTKNVSIKATTTERLGYIGSGDAIAAYAVVALSG